MLTKEMIQFQLPAADTVGVPAGQPQGFNLVCPMNPRCHTQLWRVQLFWWQPMS